MRGKEGRSQASKVGQGTFSCSDTDSHCDAARLCASARWCPSVSSAAVRVSARAVSPSVRADCE